MYVYIQTLFLVCVMLHLCVLILTHVIYMHVLVSWTQMDCHSQSSEDQAKFSLFIKKKTQC